MRLGDVKQSDRATCFYQLISQYNSSKEWDGDNEIICAGGEHVEEEEVEVAVVVVADTAE